MKHFVKKGLILAGVIAGTVASQAAVDVSGVELDVAPVEQIAVVLLGALALIWVARKIVGFLR